MDILLSVSACKFRTGLLLSIEIFFEKVIIFSLIWYDVLVLSLVVENEEFNNGVKFNLSLNLFEGHNELYWTKVYLWIISLLFLLFVWFILVWISFNAF